MPLENCFYFNPLRKVDYFLLNFKHVPLIHCSIYVFFFTLYEIFKRFV